VLLSEPTWPSPHHCNSQPLKGRRFAEISTRRVRKWVKDIITRNNQHESVWIASRWPVYLKTDILSPVNRFQCLNWINNCPFYLFFSCQLFSRFFFTRRKSIYFVYSMSWLMILVCAILLTVTANSSNTSAVRFSNLEPTDQSFDTHSERIIFSTFLIKLQQSLCRPGQPCDSPVGSRVWGFQISRQSAHEGGKFL